MWTKLRRILTWIIASTDTEARLESIAYLEGEWAGELHVNPSPSLRQLF